MKEKQVQPLEQLYKKLQEDNIKVPDNFLSFASNLDDSQKASQLHQFLVGKNYDVPEDYEKFSKVLNIGQDLKKKESTSPDSGLTSSPNLVDASSSEIGGDSTTVNPDSGNLGSLLDVDPTASEIGTPEKTNNPAKSFGKSFWKSMAYDMPSGLAGTAATAIGLGEQILKLPEINARIHEIVNKDSSLEQKAKMELGDIGKMLQKYQDGLDTGDISQDKFNELSSQLIKRANFITNNGFTDLVQDDDATKLQKSLTKWAVNRQNKGAEFTKDITNSLDQIQDPIDALNWLSSALGQSTAYIPASVVSGGATSFGVEIGSIYTDAVNRIAEREGITPEEVIDRGLDDPASAFAFGMAAGLLDKIGADEVMKIGKQSFMKSLRKRALSGGLTEAPTEAAQTILEQYGVMSSIDKKEDLNWAEIGESAAQGFVGGAGISSATEAINQTTNKTKGNETTRTLSDDSGNSTTSQNDEKYSAETSQDGSQTGQSKGSNLGNEQPQNPDQVKNEQPRDSKKSNAGDAVVEQGQDGANGNKPSSQQPNASQEAAGVEGANAEKSPIKGAGEQAQSGAGKVKETQKPLQSDQDNVKQTPNSLPKEGETISWKGEDGWQVGKTNTTASGKEVIELKKGDVIENVPVKDLAKNLNKPTPNLSKGPKSLTKDKKFDYEPASRQDAIAKMFGEGMRIDTKDFKSMAGNNWVKDQKSLPLNYTASEKGLKRDQLFQILDEQYPELAATTNEQDFAQEVVDFITEYPQHPGNYVDQVVAQRDKDIEYAIANEKSKAVSMVRSHSMFMDLDEADQKDFDDMSDDDVLSLYLEIEKDSESFVDKFPSTITTAEELLNEVDQYLKDPEGYFGSFMDDNLKPYAREIQQIAKSRLRGETNSTPGSQEVTPEKEASGQKKQQEVEPQNPSAFKEGDWVKSVYTGKYYEVQKTSNGVTKLKNEAGGIEEFNSNNNPHFIPDTRDTDLYGNKITPKDDKKPKQQDMFGDEPKPKGSAKQQEIDRLRKDVEAQGGQLKVNQNAKEDQGEQQPINEGIFAPKEEKGLFDDQKPMLTDEQMKAQYESDKKEITEHLGSIYIDEQGNQYEIASFKFKGWKTGQVDVEGTNGKVILSTNTSDLLDIIDGESKAKIVKSDQPNFALPEILDTSEMRKNLSQMYRKIDDAGVQDVNTDDEIAFISKFAESKGYQGRWSRDGQGNERMYFTPIQEKPSTYGKNNKIVTEDVAAKARERLRKKLGGELRTGIDPEMMQDGILLAVYHVEAGSRSFADYTKAMIDDLGESIRPYLRSFYEGVRYYPGFTSEGMSTPEQIDQELNTSGLLINGIKGNLIKDGFIAYNSNYSKNQDAIFVNNNTFIVSDGMGSYDQSGLFSKELVEVIGRMSDRTPDKILNKAKEIADRYTNAAATLTVVEKISSRKYWYFSLGDSPIYVITKEGKVKSRINESIQTRTHGFLAFEDEKGATNENEVKLGEVILNSGDKLIVSSDGFGDVFAQLTTPNINELLNRIITNPSLVRDEFRKTKKDDFSIIYVDPFYKNQQNEPIPNPSLEPDRNDGGLENQVGQEDVQRQQPEAARPDDGGREQAPKQGRLFDQGNTGIPNDSSSPTGKRGDQGLSGEQRRGQSDTGSRDAERRALPGRPRILDGDEGQPGSHTPDPKTFTKESRLSAQKKAESITPIPNDPVNIRESLPLLYPEQQDDVIKFERRINEQPTADDPKKGMLFTNGTGTGKGFTGMGIVDRFVKQGKTNILIVTPSQDVNNTWIENAKLFNIPLMLLPDTKTKGDRVRITTYANFRANQEIKKEDFDLVIYDESQTLMDNKAAAETSTTQAHYQISNRNVAAATQRITSVHPLWIKESELWDKETELQKKWKETNSLKVKAELEDVELELRDVRREQDKLKPEIERQAKEAVERTKVVFLSATPFKAHFNLKYANGYLFDWGKETTYEKKSQGFSRVDPMGRFFLDNFGAAYEWKNNQLQSRTDSNPEAVSMQEVSFADKLMEKGAMSGRKISLEYDYSREFPLVSGFNAEMFNKAFNDIMSRMDGEFKYISEYTKEVFGDYHYSTKLYEALRASMIIPRLEKHIDMGRKIIVFHRRHKEGSEPPFNKILNLAEEDAKLLITIGSETEKEKASATLQEIPIFRNKYKDLLEYEQTLNYKSTVNQLERHFGSETVKQINGMVSKNDRKEAIKEFNSDKSPVKIVVIHEEAGKTGISLHDQSGKHPRVLISTSLPQSTTTTLQIEGRSFRIGNQSDAIYEYPLLGLDSEIAHFANSLNKRLSTTENLSLGSQARDLLTSFSEGVANNSGVYEPHKNQGKGGKELDRRSNDTKTPFEKARLMYATNSNGRKNHLAEDFFATPEPLGQKMMDWLNLRESETALEPSAGLGAIAMWTPQYASITAIEPSFELYAKMSARVTNPNLKPIQEQFEDHNLVNKYHGIAMNPPFGSNSATAWEHTEKGLHHLKIGGRLVSILPAGPSLEKRVTKWQETNKDAEQYALRGKIKLPNVTFEQAGTKVNTNVWIWDRIDPRDEDAKNLSYRELDLSFAETIDEFFDELETISFGERYASKKQQKESQDIIDRRIDDFVNGRLENRENDEGSAFIENSKHEQSGAAQKLVKLGDRVSTEDFNKYKEAARKYNGFWYRGKQAFVFQKGDIEENARQFKNFINNTETESGRKPEYQYSMARGDGRTAHQIDVASKKAGKEYFRSVMKKMRTAFPEIMFSTDKQAFENVYAMWNEGNDSIKKPNAIRWNDKIFFNPDQIYQDTPIHEFAHIWVELTKNHQGAIYKRGLQLIKDSAYHEAVKGNPFYEGQSEQAQLEEALVMAIGEKGAVLEDRNAFVKWVNDLWQKAKRFFGFTPKMDIFNIKLDEFVQRAAQELLAREQISKLSSLKMPETASMKLNTFKTTKEAWKDAQDRVLINELLSENPEAWNKARHSYKRKVWEDVMTGLQDETRPIFEVQKEIVDNYISNTKEKINDRTDIDDKAKKRLIKEFESSRSKIKERLIADNDVHSALDLKSGKVQNAQEQMRKLFFGRHSAGTGMGSMLDWMTKSTTIYGEEHLDPESVAGKLKAVGLTLIDLGFYAQVKHSKNFNERVRKLSFERGDDQLINDGSGMTNEEADAFMKEFEADPEKLAVLEEQWEVMREELILKPLDMKKESGMISEELYKNLLKDKFGETYVPLQVAPKAFAKSPYTSKVLGKGIHGIKGTNKYKFYDRVNPFVQAVASFDKAMNDIEQNKVLQKFYNLVEQNEEPTLWKIHKPQMVDKMIVNKSDIEKEPLFDQYDDQDMDLMEAIKQEGGEITRDIIAVGKLRPEVINLPPNLLDRSVRVYVDGKPRYIEINDPKLLSVFKKSGGFNNEAVNMILSGLNSTFNYFRLVYTGANLDFALPNFVRDLQDALINLSDTEVKNAKRNVIKNIPKAWKGVINFEKGNMDSEMAKWYADMKENGGEISWLNYNSAEREYANIEKEIRRYQEINTGEQVINIAMYPPRFALKTVLLINKMFEMGTRLSVYKTMVEAGVSRQKAAVAAKNVTVNFNKKGNWNPLLSSLYLFVNAGIQGNVRHLTSLARSKKARILTTSMMVSMYMLRYLNDAMDDDDEMDKLLTDFDYENNVVLYNPFNPSMPITIPISYNLKGWKAIADNTYDVQHGKKDIGEAVASTFGTFADAMLPMSSSKGVPTIAQPVVELAFNHEMHSDKPVYKERMPWDYNKKDSELYFGTPRELSIEISKQLGYVIDNQDDVLEISPNSIDYLFDWSLGGMKAVLNTGDVALKLSQRGYGNGLDWNKVMVARRFVKDLEDQTWRHKVNYYKLTQKGLTEKMSPEDKKQFIELGNQLIKMDLLDVKNFYSDKKKLYRVQSQSFQNGDGIFGK